MKRWLAVTAAMVTVTACVVGVMLLSSTDDPAPRARLASITQITGRGAALPFAELEAEHATTDGTVIGPGRTHGTLAGEASGRMAVTLAPGQHLTFTLPSTANAISLRYSIPDTADGLGHEAELRLATGGASLPSMALTSRYAWLYGGFPFHNTPGDGARHLYDSTRLMLGRDLPAGATVTLTATVATTVDLADVEQVAPPLSQPPDSLSAVDFGADPTGAADSLAAFTRAVAAARAQRKVLYLPAGRYAVPGHVTVDDVTIAGAGMWHTELRGAGVGLYGRPAPMPSRGVHLKDFAIIGEVADRDDRAALAGVGGALGGGSELARLWIQHVKVGMWLDGPFAGLTISGCRISDVTADGINLHQGVSDTTIVDNLVRNTGDDGIAMWSEAGPDGFTGALGANHHNAIAFNTVQLPMLANGIAAYGGHDNTISDNVVADIQVEGGGIHVGNRFSATLLSGTTVIDRNTILRGGADHPFLTTPIGALWFYAKDAPMTGRILVRDNDLLDSGYAAVQVFGSSVSGIEITQLTIDGAGTYALQVQAAGSLALADATVAHLGAEPVFHCADAAAFTVTGQQLGAGTCGLFAPPRYAFAQAVPSRSAAVHPSITREPHA